jgi:two-component system alkaline phosphatase synthesis response regulator PhoP
MRVFVVDDDESYCSMMERMLGADGHEVVVAHRGAEALMRALAEEFDVLICDLMLPDLHGTEVIRALKAQSPDLPVMVASALNPDEWREQCVNAGASGYLQKPIALQLLRDELAMIEQSRPDLTVWVIDPDELHRNRLRRELTAHGCRVTVFRSADGVRGPGWPHLLLIEAGVDGALKLIAEAEGSAAMTFGDQVAPEREEALLRAGAALCMAKPVDVDQLMIQARFLAHA